MTEEQERMLTWEEWKKLYATPAEGYTSAAAEYYANRKVRR